MKKFALGILTLAFVATSANASAQTMNEDWLDKNMGFGVGAGSGIVQNGMNTGLSLRFFPVEAFGLELVVGGGRDRRSVTTPAQSATQPETTTFTRTSHFDLSLIADYRFLRSNRAALSGYFGLGISIAGAGQSFQSNTFPGQFVDGSASQADVAFELGIRGEVFLYKYFSIFGRIGINMNPHTKNELPLGGYPPVDDPQTPPQPESPFDPSVGGMRVSAFDQGNLLGMFGFTVWFN